jgi:hypothetical protein
MRLDGAASPASPLGGAESLSELWPKMNLKQVSMITPTTVQYHTKSQNSFLAPTLLYIRAIQPESQRAAPAPRVPSLSFCAYVRTHASAEHTSLCLPVDCLSRRAQQQRRRKLRHFSKVNQFWPAGHVTSLATDLGALAVLDRRAPVTS